MKRFSAILIFLTLLWACSSDNGGGSMSDDIEPVPMGFERGPMLTNWADNIIVPAYEAFNAQLDALNASFDTFKADPSESNLSALRTSWLSAYRVWQHVSMFEIGPAEAVGFRLNMNIYPADTGKIENHIVSGNYDLSLSSNRDAKGFPALDYLINGLGDTDTAIVSKFSTADSDGLIAYFDAVLSDMTTLSAQVLSEWKEGYRDIFIAGDGSSSTASVDRFVNDYIFYFEKYLRAGKMGIPLGVFSGSALPENVEAYYKGDVSKELFLEGLDAAQDFFNGKHYGKSSTGQSLASYLDALNTVKEGADLKKLINDQFDKARTMVDGLSSFKNEIETKTPPTDMLLAYDEVQRIVPLLKVDMVSAMSISIDFVDADGD